MTLPHLVFGSPHLDKMIQQVRVDGIGLWDAEYAVNFRDDFNAMDGETWESSETAPDLFGGAGTFGGSGTFAPSAQGATFARYYTLAIARAFSPKLSGSDTADAEIRAVTVAYSGRTD